MFKKLFLTLSFILGSSVFGSFEPVNNSSLALKAKIATAVGVAGIAMAKASYNFSQVREIAQKRDYDHVIFGDYPETETKMSKWGLTDWCSARLIKAHSKDVIKLLEAQRRSFNLKLSCFDGAIQKPLDSSWESILLAISKEKDQMLHDILWLEKNHLVYLKNIPCCDSFGVRADYLYACRTAPKNIRGYEADPQSPGSWTEAQERHINQCMENPWWEPLKNYNSSWKIINSCAALKDHVKSALIGAYKVMFKLVKPNYSFAAQTYWKLFTSWQRLSELEKVIQLHVFPFRVPAPVLNAHINIQQNV